MIKLTDTIGDRGTLTITDNFTDSTLMDWYGVDDELRAEHPAVIEDLEILAEWLMWAESMDDMNAIAGRALDYLEITAEDA